MEERKRRKRAGAVKKIKSRLSGTRGGRVNMSSISFFYCLFLCFLRKTTEAVDEQSLLYDHVFCAITLDTNSNRLFVFVSSR